MIDISEKSIAQQRALLPARLSRGAAVLGNLWRAGERCEAGWARLCACEAAGKFCAAKKLWIELLQEFAPPILLEMTGEEEYFVILAMSPRDLFASGLRVLVEIPGREPLLFGPEAVQWASWPAVGPDEAAWAKSVRIQKILRKT